MPFISISEALERLLLDHGWDRLRVERGKSKTTVPMGYFRLTRSN